MDNAIRFGVSLEPRLLEKFDSIINQEGYSNRSEAIRDLIRAYVSKDREGVISGIIRIVYDPRVKPYMGKIAELQNDYHCLIINVLKKFIDHHKCLELMVVNGKKERLAKFIMLLKKDPSTKEIKFEEFGDL